MTTFTTPELNDRLWINELSAAENLRSADFSFGVIYCWRYKYVSSIARLGDRLLMRICDHGTLKYSYPVGRGDLMPALTALREDAKGLNIPFILRGIPREVLPAIETAFSDKPEVSFDDRFSDYVYSAEDLANLPGRRYHSKKNHVNRFMAENDWVFEPLSRSNIDECRRLAAAWFIDAAAQGYSDLTGEIKALNKAFDNYEPLGFDGGLIRVDGEAVAFTMGEMVSPDTLVTHFEKASLGVNDGYAMINQQFSKYMLDKYPGLTYINREEDMGIENLRKAKQSYRPVFMVDKYTAVWK